MDATYVKLSLCETVRPGTGGLVCSALDRRAKLSAKIKHGCPLARKVKVPKPGTVTPFFSLRTASTASPVAFQTRMKFF